MFIYRPSEYRFNFRRTECFAANIEMSILSLLLLFVQQSIGQGDVSFDPRDRFYFANQGIQPYQSPNYQVPQYYHEQPPHVTSSTENYPQRSGTTSQRYTNRREVPTNSMSSRRIDVSDARNSSSLASSLLEPVPRIKAGETDPRSSLRELKISERKCAKYNEEVYYIQVVGGTPADDGEFPYMAALGWGGTNGFYDYRCGGALIAEDYVLTAAHCTSLYGKSPIVAKLGGGRLDDEGDGETINIERIILHPQYSENAEYNDIALLKLETKSSEFKPACLWTEDRINKTQVRAVGYGHTVFAGPASNQLLKVNLTLFSNNVCSNYYRPNQRIQNGIVTSQLCAGDPKHEKDTCQGDSGGPVIIENDKVSPKIHFIVGVTSIGLQCAGVAPSVYIRVSSYIDWIESVVWPNGS